MPSTAAEWIAWSGVAIPLRGLVGDALAYVVKLYQDARVKRHERFFELMKYIDSRDLPLATKLAATYQLREFPEHKDFIIRFFEATGTRVSGEAADILNGELKRPADFLREFK
jgi:hypothetical protein